MLPNILQKLECQESTQTLLQAIQNKKTTALYEIAEGEYSFLSALLHIKLNRPIIIVQNNEVKAAKLCKELENLGCPALHVPARDKQFSRVAQSQEAIWDRLTTLCKITETPQTIICCSMEAFNDIQCPKENLQNQRFTLQVGEFIAPQDILEKLLKIGFEHVQMVEGKGQCALRGDILDIFSPHSGSAIRIEFFDDEIDTIRSFDCISQRSVKNIEACEICPASECLLTAKQSEAAITNLKALIHNASLTQIIENLDLATEQALQNDFTNAEENLEHSKEKIKSDITSLKEGYPLAHYQTLLHLLYPGRPSILQYVKNPLLILIQPERLQEQHEANLLEYQNRLQEAMCNGFAFAGQKEILHSYEYFLENVLQHDIVTCSDLKRGMGRIQPETVIKCGSMDITPYQSQIKLLIKDLERYLSQEYSVYILAGSDVREQRLKTTLQEFGIAVNTEEFSPYAVNVLPESLNQGFMLPQEKIIVIADGDIYGTSYKKLKSKIKGSEKIASYTELNHGDYVVHESYGIGVYEGIVNVERDKTAQDYIVISYAGGDKLYVPTDQFDRVQKFSTAQSSTPKINKLGGTEWQRKKNKVKSGLKELAFNLLKLYAQRQQSSGFAYSKENPWQLQFEDQFPFELTIDQDKCIQEIYSDMESHRTMDRLLCGDVGYGKTELAMRAAFKAVCDGKQVAMLAPTTILAQQHFQSIGKRFRQFPVKYGMLSRFKTAKEQKQTLAELKNGDIDIIVGTHRLLAKDVEYKNLGLLIVDEEQRFGVGHKEIIKNLKQNIDVLTLSATPIPRTLYMSMIGVRDISVIETPPEDRLPVKTYVIEHNDAIVKDAILRELKRGGQTYYLYNKVDDIEQVATKLRNLIPDCRVAVAHGQMKESQLESTMLAFYAGTYDVLLCTTIIENGLDIPTANTLIVHDADHFGLSQLYQLRGRVGRSTRQAYAYFTVRPDRSISEVAQKRLLAIREFTEFGAGYRIAMRDLEIRGAGNIFGPEQSGHLTEIGFDMYLKLIEQALQEAQGIAVQSDIESRIDLPLDSYLPKNYVKSEKERIEIYKRIAMIHDQESRMDIEEELIDRYGDLPEEVVNLCLIAHLRAYTRKLMVSLVQIRDGFLLLHMDEKNITDPLLLLEAISACDTRFVFSQRQPTGLRFISTNQNVQSTVKEVIPLLEKLCNFIAEHTLSKENENEETKPD